MRTFTYKNQTQNQLWKDRVQGLINGIGIFFKDGVMTEVACENNGKCDDDQRSFKAYFARWLGYTAIVAPWTREQIDPLLKASAKAAAAQCNAGADQVTCGLRWIDNGKNDGKAGVGEQMAALEIVQSLLYPSVSGPAAADRGGLSKSNPDAGNDAPDEPMSTLDSITTTDKVGAIILTVVVLLAMIVGAWWMVW
jgi:mannan endo-1,6-alpha-mannosidase